MAVSAVGQTPFAIYAQESSLAAASSTPLRARVVTTEAGLSFGKFGISYTSRNVELLSDDVSVSAANSGSDATTALGGFSRAESFAAVLEAATLSQRMAEAGSTCGSCDWAMPLATRPYAAAAYSATSTAGLTPPPSRTLLATV
ncbi:hypothetical protein G3N56_07480 [Desulfovibrio sulfodismutans]|uniref:Uncharacterized protein n=1 Tax=Desulfolutivibrio sulfodismutans TaxID=63561 RepID=A0A7K3NL73_9BACT|nr:hypothetical protein [Desulfolutivibrio sulfodismutans]NDY56583.1 hypothetical protein [Desulfolutivibrio sulfodismutans]QLA13041.1 hypothetical protein GD606_12580 [Desulfolutivibrio sulfodismutans DSM 3696]